MRHIITRAEFVGLLILTVMAGILSYSAFVIASAIVLEIAC